MDKSNVSLKEISDTSAENGSSGSVAAYMTTQRDGNTQIDAV